MMKDDLPIDVIAKYTGLPLDEIRKLGVLWFYLHCYSFQLQTAIATLAI